MKMSCKLDISADEAMEFATRLCLYAKGIIYNKTDWAKT